MAKKRVLWIEDDARHDLPQLAASIYMDGGYDLVIAENATEGLDHLLRQAFDVIIVDIRLLPGSDSDWIELYKKAGQERAAARLGLKMLYTILGHEKAEVSLGDRRPEWITPDKIGILTVESRPELEEDLENLEIGIRVYKQKRAEVPDTVLLDMIRQVLESLQWEDSDAMSE